MSKFLRSLIAGTFGLSLALASPALAFHGGGGGGMHGGFGGMHRGFGGMHGFGGMRGVGGGPRFAHAAFAPRAGFAFRGAHGFGRGFHHVAFNHRFFHHRFHRRFAFLGVPFLYAGYGYYDDCWRRVWAPYGWRWVNVCYAY
jgi:hypothetical protein